MSSHDVTRAEGGSAAQPATPVRAPRAEPSARDVLAACPAAHTVSTPPPGPADDPSASAEPAESVEAAVATPLPG